MKYQPLVGVRIKIGRAKKHFNHLNAEVEAFKKRNPYEVVVDENTQPGTQIFKLRIKEEVPITWAGAVGDILHNLRSALDMLAVALAIQNGNTSKSALNETYFPIGADKSIFDKIVPSYLHYVSPKARNVIQRLRPYKGGTDAFWRLHKLDILDKHVLIIPVGAANSEVQWTVDVAGTFKDLMPGTTFPTLPPLALRPGKRVYPLKDGQELFRFNRVGANGKVDPGQHKYNFVFEIAFGEGQIVDGEPLMPTLRQFIDFIERIITIFDRKFF